MNIPNIITMVRVLLVPLLAIFLLEGEFEHAFFVFVIAGVSDALDGFLARVLHQKTTFGAVLDPIADKSLLITAFVILAVIGQVPDWLTVLVVSRDLIIVGGIGILMFNQREVRIRPSYISKATTFMQLATIAFFLGHQYMGPLLSLEDMLIGLTALCTVLSGAHYITIGFGLLGERTDGEDDGGGKPPASGTAL